MIKILLLIIFPYSTYYYPHQGTFTASGDEIIPEKVISGEHRWIAVSHDIKKLYSYGDTVIVSSLECPNLNGEWVVKDLMHRKWKNKIDFLIDRSQVRSIGFNRPHKVWIKKKERAQK